MKTDAYSLGAVFGVLAACKPGLVSLGDAILTAAVVTITTSLCQAALTAIMKRREK